MYRLTWRSVMCLPDNQGSPAIAGGTLIETAQAAHLTGHPNCRQAAIVVVAADPEVVSDYSGWGNVYGGCGGRQRSAGNTMPLARINDRK
jgi:hypothetical protein